MKNFLIELFRPLDTLIFNHLVRIGGIKPFLNFLAPIAGKILGSTAAKTIGTQLVGNAVGKALGGGGSQGVTSGTNQMIDQAVAAQRTPEEIIRATYGPEGF